MNSIQISIEADEAQQEILVSELSEMGAEGFEQTESRLIAYFGELNFDSYEVNTALKDYKFTVSTVKEQNWNQAWEQSFQPVVVGDFCAVRAGFHQPIEGVGHEVVITPKMSFGTGHHATTYMMIEQMAAMDFAGRKVFDFGTGTGILAILADKLGAGHVTAIDVDPWSVDNARENIENNRSSRVSLALSSELPREEYDIVLANINRNVILQYLPGLAHMLRKDGRLLLSGLLATDEEAIVSACAAQRFRQLRRSERSNWISLLFVNSL